MPSRAVPTSRWSTPVVEDEIIDLIVRISEALGKSTNEPFDPRSWKVNTTAEQKTKQIYVRGYR